MITLSKRGVDDVLTRPVALPRVNLLPPEIGEARRFRRVQAGLVGGVAVAVAVVVVVYGGASRDVSDAEAQLDSASQDQRTLQASTVQYRDVTATYERASRADAMLTTAMGQEVRYSTYLSALTRSIPSGVWVKTLVYDQAAGTSPAPGSPGAATAGTASAGIGTVTVTGIAFAHADVGAWLDSLAAQSGYAAPLFTISEEVLLGDKKVVNWSSTAVLPPEAVSGRYAKTGN